MTNAWRVIKDLARKYCTILQSVVLFEGDGFDDSEAKQDVTIVRWYGRVYALVGWDAELYQKTLVEVQRMYPNISRATVEARFSHGIIDLLVQNASMPFTDIDESTVERKALEIHNTLVSLVRHYTVFIPLEGIEFKISSLELGNVVLYSNTAGMLPDLIGNPEVHFSYQHAKKTLPMASCYLVAEIEGDGRFAKERAFSQARDVIHILNLYLGSCRYRKDYPLTFPYENILSDEYTKQKIDIWGASSTNDQVYYSLSSSPDPECPESDRRFHFELWKPAFYTFPELYDLLEPLHKELGHVRRWLHQIDASSVQEFNELGLDIIVSSFESSSEISSRIRRSVVWYSKAVNTDSRAEQFVALAIALENLLVGGGQGQDPRVSWGSITQRLAERVAFLLGEGFESRCRLARDTKRLYRVRSKIVHQGQDASDDDLYLMEGIAKRSILTFAKHQFASWDAFLQWEKKQKYNVERDNP